MRAVVLPTPLTDRHRRQNAVGRVSGWKRASRRQTADLLRKLHQGAQAAARAVNETQRSAVGVHDGPGDR